MLHCTVLQNRLFVALPITLLLSATVFQGYMLYIGLILATDVSLVRYVTGNELILLWFTLASIPVQWSAMHIAAKAYFWEPSATPRGNTARINWLPVGTRLQIILWSGYTAVLLTFAACTSVLLYKLQQRSSLTVLVLTYATPIVASVIALPPFARKLLKHLRHRREHEQGLLDDYTITQSVVPVSTYRFSNAYAYTKKSGNVYLPSETSQEINASQSTRCSTKVFSVIHSDRSHLKTPEIDGKHEPFSPISNTHSQATEDSMATLKNSQNILHIQTQTTEIAEKIAGIILQVVTYSPLAVLAALFSVAMYVVIFSSALEQYRNLLAMPPNLPDLAAATAVYADGTKHPVYLSISCKGALPPELTAKSADGYPQQATILIEHMSGFTSLVVRSIQDALVEQGRRVCIYDRPGYLLSPQGFAPIAPVAMEKALGAALSSIGERGPYYLVGHHSGSENAHLFLRENERAVVGMAFIYPTDASLLGLMSGGANITEKKSMVISMTGDSMIAENTYSSITLNVQRMLSAIGIWSGTASTETNTNVEADNQRITEWALANTHIVQAQYFEHLQRQPIVGALEDIDITVVDTQKKLPVLLLGVDANRTTYNRYLDYVDERYKVEIPDVGESQPLMLSHVARQIAWHIARIS